MKLNDELFQPGTPIVESLRKLPFTSLDEMLGFEVLYVIGVVGILQFFMKVHLPDGLRIAEKPLRLVIILYDLLQVVCNTIVVILVIVNPELISFAWKDLNKVHYIVVNDEHRRLIILGLSWYYLKILDLADTVFFVIRGKFEHVSLLQVYHHSSLVALVWVSMTLVPVSQNLFYAMLNSCIHIVMYSYYLATCMGFKVWWKKYLTAMQMIQFVIMVVFTLFLLINIHDNREAVAYTAVVGFQACVFLALFLNFYVRRYIKNRTKPRID